MARVQYIRKVHGSLRSLKDSAGQVQRAVEKLTEGSGSSVALGVDEAAAGAAADRLQGAMERLQAELASFKGSMRSDYESTAAEERSLSRDLAGLEARLAAWQAEEEAANAPPAPRPFRAVPPRAGGPAPVAPLRSAARRGPPVAAAPRGAVEVKKELKRLHDEVCDYEMCSTAQTEKKKKTFSPPCPYSTAADRTRGWSHGRMAPAGARLFPCHMDPGS